VLILKKGAEGILARLLGNIASQVHELDRTYQFGGLRRPPRCSPSTAHRTPDCAEGAFVTVLPRKRLASGIVQESRAQYSGANSRRSRKLGPLQSGLRKIASEPFYLLLAL
jgi:hypothetical protein